MSMDLLFLLILVIAVALFFALTNGLHDASSVVATFISCGAATPSQAILLASFFGLLGAVLGGSAVANTVSKVVNLPANPEILTILLAAMLGAVVWNILTWKWGLPSSSTHALIGGIVGAVGVSKGFEHVLWGWSELINHHELTGIMKIIVALILSPLIGFASAFILQKITMVFLKNAKFCNVNNVIKRLQWALAALLAYSHGANDTQKVIGLITLALTASGAMAQQAAPLWVKLSGGIVMFIGTIFGGWSIMKTLGRGIFTIRPIHSLNSQISSGAAVEIATILGAPVSTTHVVVGTIVGVGAAEEYKMVNWQMGKEIIIAWCITIPSSALVAMALYYPIVWITKWL